ncbi:Protodermal factor 1 [Raphanus sativus]|uniref:Protodermal factor 1 n=1 Tax=Raphanus sativus TaxID=3726 RepID=A0A6J0JHS5_RAPSA|nr:protodermal factor 1 [Raphanus sativus]KAJ4892191.1 Protodermal factor 1 [Raphanus sativus]
MRGMKSLTSWALFAALLSQQLFASVASIKFEDEKTYYSPPDPNAGSPPSGTPPSHGGYTPTPSTPSHTPPSNCGSPPYDPTPPSHTPTPSTPSHTPSTPSHTPTPSTPSHTPTPSHTSPPCNCGTPPSHPSTPSRPSRPSHPSRPSRPSTPSNPPSGGYYSSPPPSTPVVETPPTPIVDPGTPSTGGTPPSSGGYYSSPPPSTPVVETPPTPIVDPGTPIIGETPPTPSSGGYYSSPPPTPIVNPGTPIIGGTPPTPFIDPGTPGTPFLPAPFPPISGTCDYWRNHPTLIWGLLGWWGTVGGAFGTLSTPSIIPGFDPHMNLLQALSNTRTDAIGSLYREGTASWLNSMVNSQFPFTTPQVRDHFLAGLSSTKAATKQAQTFKLANEGRLKPRV